MATSKKKTAKKKNPAKKAASKLGGLSGGAAKAISKRHKMLRDI